MLDFQPSTVVVLILMVLIAKHLVSAIGKTSIQDNAWSCYALVAGKLGHPKFKELSKKRAELQKVNHERKSISAQDEYARWTKLNRTHDKLSTEVAELAETLLAEKTRITKIVNLAITLLTTAPIWFARYKYRKLALFYMPPGIFPHPMEWIFALPFMATGTVGLTVWMFAVNSVLSSVSMIVAYFFEAAVEKPAASPGASTATGAEKQKKDL